MRIQGTSSAQKHVKLSCASLDCLALTDGAQEACIQGNVSRDGTYGWLARGGFLEVFWLRTGQRLAAWCFGAQLKEPTTTITAVSECCFDKGSKLIVATSTVNAEGLICLFDVKNSTIMKAIEIPFEAKSLEVVSTVSRGHSDTVVLSPKLSHFCGVLAIGTQCGHVYLIDLCLDDDVDGCDELSPNTLQYLDGPVKDMTSKRFNALTRGKHLCLELGDEFHTRGYFNYRKPDGTPVKSFDAGDICVSALKFVPQTGLLVVGMSFGCVLLWRLQETALEYSSRYEEDLPPVTHISYQEPENDPRNFCYLWILKGPMVSQSVEAHTSIATLFQLGYSKKTWYDGFGYLFEELSSVGPRFEHMLTSDPFNQASFRDEGSRVISCFTVTDPNYQLPVRRSDDSFEGTSGPDISLCAMVWEAAPSDPHSKPPCFLGLFDMNRWYHAQMPIELRIYSGSDVCPYFAMFSLDGIQQQTGTDNIMSLFIRHESLTKFHSGMIPEPEQHFYPSSLSFDVSCVSESGVVHATYLGVQGQILSDLETRGPAAVSEPHDMYAVCQHAGLLARTSDTPPAWYKREALLTLALDRNMTGFINSCVAAWATGEFTVVGCSLRFVLEWSWKKIAQIKESVDQLCMSLFDWSGLHLDAQTLTLLHRHRRTMDGVRAVLGSVSALSPAVTEQGRAELATRTSVVTLLGQHLGLVLWSYDQGLLPEHSEEESDEDVFVYPARALTEYYKKRRTDLTKLHSDVKATDVLMIDALVSHMGEPLANLWETNGEAGLYPPKSMHALLNICLLESVPQKDKFVVMFYLLCDLLNSAPDDLQPAFNEKVQRFTQSYNLPLGLAKLVQGMWLLDHRDFQDSLFYLLDPAVTKEMFPWQHTVILKALLYQGRHRLAHQYLTTRSPPLTTPADIKLKLTILLANGLIAEAFEYQRISRDKHNIDDLLSHVFLGCQQTKAVDQLLLLPFSGEEERHLVNYLLTVADGRSQELLVLYYLLRSRYVEAYRLSHNIRQRAIGECDQRSRERSRVLTSLVEGYHKVLPCIQRKLCLGPEQPLQQRIRARYEYTRPAPLSTVVNQLHVSQTLSRAKLLQSVLEKVMEVKEETEEETEGHGDPRIEESPNKAQEPGPFICTPMTPRVVKKSRLSEVVFAASKSRLEAPEALHGPPTSPRGLMSPYKSRMSAVTASPAKMDTSGHTNTLKRKSVMSAEALSLLMTPPVKRRSRCRDVTAGPTATPQSILKVSQGRARTDPSRTDPAKAEPAWKNTAPTSLREKLNFQAEELVLPTPPRLQRRVTMGTRASEARVTDTPADVTTDVGDTTTKHLRFVGVSPDAVPTDAIATDAMATEVGAGDSRVMVKPLTRKSLRDRSPTPERKSPKMASRTDQISPQAADTPPVVDISEPVTMETEPVTRDITEESEPVVIDDDEAMEDEGPVGGEPVEEDDEEDTVEDIQLNGVEGDDHHSVSDRQSDSDRHSEPNRQPAVLLAEQEAVVGTEDTVVVVDNEITINLGDKTHNTDDMDTEDTEPLAPSIAAQVSSSSQVKVSTSVPTSTPAPADLSAPVPVSVAPISTLPDIISSTTQDVRLQSAAIKYASSELSETPSERSVISNSAPDTTQTRESSQTRDATHTFSYPRDIAPPDTISGTVDHESTFTFSKPAEVFSPSQEAMDTGATRAEDAGRDETDQAMDSDVASVNDVAPSLASTTDDISDSDQQLANQKPAAEVECRRKSIEEGEKSEVVTEIVTDNKRTTIVETTTYKKVTTETVRVLGPEEVMDESTPAEQNGLPDDPDTHTPDDPDTHTPDDPDTHTPAPRKSPGRRAMTRSASRRGQKPDTVPRVTRRQAAQDTDDITDQDGDEQEAPLTPSRRAKKDAEASVEAPKTDAPRTPTRRGGRRDPGDDAPRTPTRGKTNAEPSTPTRGKQAEPSTPTRGKKHAEPRTPTRRQAARDTKEGPSPREPSSQPCGPEPCHAHGPSGPVTTPTARSPRLLSPRRSPRLRSPSLRCCPVCQVAPRTPPRATRLSSALPPTPPKSTTSSPVRATSSPVRATSSPVTRSRSSSPADALTHIVPKPRGRGGHTRTSSRASVSPGHSVGKQGPLSEDSFMMRLRKTPSRETTPDRRLQKTPSSRETTPDRRQSLDRVTRASVERASVDRENFTFSNPLSLDEAAEETFLPATPLHPFIFSPPITRSRRRDSLQKVKAADVSTNNSPVLEAAKVSSPAKNTRQAKKKEKVTHPPSVHESVSESTINFLSPVKEEELPRGRVTRQRATRGRQGDTETAPKTLRPRTAAAGKKRKPLQW